MKQELEIPKEAINEKLFNRSKVVRSILEKSRLSRSKFTIDKQVYLTKPLAVHF